MGVGVSTRCRVVEGPEGAQVDVDSLGLDDVFAGRSVGEEGGELVRSVVASDPLHSVSKCLLQSSMIT